MTHILGGGDLQELLGDLKPTGCDVNTLLGGKGRVILDDILVWDRGSNQISGTTGKEQ